MEQFPRTAWFITEKFPSIEYLAYVNDIAKKINSKNIRFNIGFSNIAPYNKNINVKIGGVSYGSSLINAMKKEISGQFEVPAENIVLGSGASHLNLNIISLLVNPDDEVIIEDPVYEPLLKNVVINTP